MALIYLDDLRLNAVLEGPAEGPALVLIHALGTDLTSFDGVIPHLPETLRILRYDQRGHGRSDTPPAPYAMGRMIRDCERLMEHFALTEAVVLGVSLGGLVAQGLASKRLDLVRGLVLSNTAARIGTPAQWQGRIEAVRAGGIDAIADATLERWFGRNWRSFAGLEPWRDLLLRARPEGWCGAAAAIAGSDFYTTTAALSLPTLAIAGAHDGSTPPDLVRETAALIRGHRFALMRGAGHLPFAEKPAEYAALVGSFLHEIGHV
jgi:3-oxoadipate enol-lactonase